MMPCCEYRRCKRTATERLGSKIIIPDETDGFGKPWEQVVYLCPKHIKKIRKLLSIKEVNNA